MWNPFKAIGDAIGRVFGREESAPTPQQERQPEPQEERQLERQPEPQERGFFGQIWDRVSGADRRRDELETRERQLEERQQQIETRERQLEERLQQIEAREQAIAPAPAPTPTPEQAIAPAPAPERELPKFASDGPDYMARDERAFGTDSEIGRELEGAVDNFIMDRGGLDGLSADAREWLQSPTVSEPFSNYWHSGGFSADQVLAGMQNITNIKITEGEDGEIQVEFDYDAEVDGYEVHGHAS
jgi:hypothetical protein